MLCISTFNLSFDGMNNNVVPSSQIICPIQSETVNDHLVIRVLVLLNSYLPIGNYSISEIKRNGETRYVLSFYYKKNVNRVISTGKNGEIVLEIPKGNIDLNNFYYSDNKQQLKIKLGTKETWLKVVEKCKEKSSNHGL